ncbi:MAG: lipopolysaccharide heptosyltransferase II [Candidatus Binatus sp.]|uniref:lipopolysaccharide heptosyltransferase II n=1 Tax=Candidatus Binatus sp. TaxID=2811406 RepID=UPI00271867A2|nr:lipopolysaccharide heptosyltransferase II [Candidatus Binatus sp.]MDO8434783.1 lipopolysaccharide heptosyltransferase II [Candidatus Binatus sp.]
MESGKTIAHETRDSRADSIAPALTPAPRRILVKEVNWLGDLVISLPALRAIRATWSDAHLAVLVKRELAGFFDGVAWVNEVIPYSVARGLPGLIDRRRIIKEIRSRQFDLGVLFPNSFESALWLTMAGIARRAGFIADARGAMLTHKTLPPREAMTGHQSQYWLSMVRLTIGVSETNDKVALEAHGPHREKMRRWLLENRKRKNARLIAIAPAAAYGPAKEWPAARYGALIDLLASRDDAEVVLVGAPGERAKCIEVAAATKVGAIVAAGHTTVGELNALLSLCDGFIGNDSGCAHLAGALGIPTLAIFGSTNPARTAPIGNRALVIYRKLECSPCLARTCRFGHYNCLTQIKPEELAGAMRTLSALI